MLQGKLSKMHYKYMLSLSAFHAVTTITTVMLFKVWQIYSAPSSLRFFFPNSLN